MPDKSCYGNESIFLKMENIILTQFLIGDEFAMLEFDLEYLETKLDKNGIEFKYYRYNRELSDLGIGIKEVVLVYNCDVLRGVFALAKCEKFG